MRLQTKIVTAAAVTARTDVEIEAARMTLPFLLIKNYSLSQIREIFQ
jgi:hypothetical protein